MAIDFLYFYNWARKKSVRIRRDDILLKRHGMDLKLMNSYKLVSFNVVVLMAYKRCHTITTKLTNLMLLKNR
ncbi:hypothetical protein COL60_30700 [Bacillus pseudomycoides]|nr:hypothetical protein CON99_30095 [Bacillus pseudomycoides]PFY95898.1 hypothetical protein COL60_30700 [Bacillus pseudomycoides]PFZ03190.1 hypothetical protein COL63_29855 [Bacillus pseudomycoides]PHA98935.1 hypothetical protein COE85_30685 [Bacillus pseudomycoides]